jgi:hypothetical protein
MESGPEENKSYRLDVANRFVQRQLEFMRSGLSKNEAFAAADKEFRVVEKAVKVVGLLKALGAPPPAQESAKTWMKGRSGGKNFNDKRKRNWNAWV